MGQRCSSCGSSKPPEPPLDVSAEVEPAASAGPKTDVSTEAAAEPEWRAPEPEIVRVFTAEPESKEERRARKEAQRQQKAEQKQQKADEKAARQQQKQREKVAKAEDKEAKAVEMRAKAEKVRQKVAAGETQGDDVTALVTEAERLEERAEQMAASAAELRLRTSSSGRSLARELSSSTAGAPHSHARWQLQGRYAGFMSHYKYEAAEAARYITDKLEGRLGVPVFLDSDDLSDLRKLCEQVVQSDVLILLLTKDVLTRPWCLIELYTAVTNRVPIVTVNVEKPIPSHRFDFDDSQKFFADFEQQLEIRNRGAAATIREEFPDVTLEQIGQVLGDIIPKVIAKPYDPAGSTNVIDAQLRDIEQAMREKAGQPPAPLAPLHKSASQTVHSAGASRGKRASPPERSAFASLRFDDAVPSAASELQAALAERFDVSLEIVNMKGGGDIDQAVIDGIEHCSTFIVFGSKHYGQDTGNPACTYYESKFAQSLKKQIILIRMIPFEEQYEQLQARVM